MKITTLRQFILFLVTPVIALTGCQNYGHELDSGNLHLFYKEGITDNLALTFGNYFAANELLPQDEKATVQLLKVPGSYQLNFVTNDSLEKDEYFISGLPHMAHLLSHDVFKDSIVKIGLCDKHMRPIRSFQMETGPLWKQYENDNYSLEYPSDWKIDDRADGYDALYMASPRMTDTFADCVTLSVFNDPTHPVTFEQICRVALSDIGTKPQGKIITTADGDKGGKRYKRIDYTYVDNGRVVLVQEVDQAQNNVGYRLRFVSYQATMTPDDLQVHNNMLNSFTLK